MKSFCFVFFIVIISVFANSCEGNSNSEKITEVELKVIKDTSRVSLSSISLDFPEEWKIKYDFQRAIILAVSPTIDTNDFFRENLVIQVYDVNEGFDKETIAKHLFKEAIKSFDGEVDSISSKYWKSNNSASFYFIEYSYSVNGIDASSVMFCTTKNEKVYAFVFTDISSHFKEAFDSSFAPIITSFKVKT